MEVEDQEAIEVMLKCRSARLSEWETQFLESIMEKETLSKKQSEKVTDIWDEGWAQQW